MIKALCTPSTDESVCSKLVKYVWADVANEEGDLETAQQTHSTTINKKKKGPKLKISSTK